MIRNINIIVSGLYFIIVLLYYACIFLQIKKIYSIARLSILVPLILQLIAIIIQSLSKGRILLSSVTEVMFILSFLIAFIYTIIDMKLQKAVFGLFLLPIIFILHSMSYIYVSETKLDKIVFTYPALSFHTISTVTGYALLLISIITSIMYLYLIYELKKKQFDAVFYNSPSLEILDRLTIIFQLIGVVCLILGVLSGFRLTILIWGDFPFLDPKIILTFFLLFYYCTGIIVRFVWKPDSRKMSIHSVLGFIIIIFLFFIVNIIFVSKHNWG